MRLFIAEDEPPARQRLEQAIARVAPQAQVLGHADSVQGTADWLAAHPPPDLLLLDIQLADGLSLELFERRPCPVPVVFTTAYDQFALQAFQALALDYLLKPVGDEALARAFAKLAGLRRHFAPDAERLAAVLDTLRPAPAGPWRQRLVGQRDELSVVLPVSQLAWVVSLDKASIAVDNAGRRCRIDQPLAELKAQLDPARFFRANRQLLIGADALRGFEAAGRGKLRLHLQPDPGTEVLVSQERAGLFRAWLG